MTPVILSGKTVHSESKSWASEYILSNVKRSLKGKAVKVKDAAGKVIDTKEEKGQMLLDFANLFANKGDSKFAIEWAFDSQMTPEMKGEVVKLLKEEFKPGGASAERLAGMLELDLKSPAIKKEWNTFLKGLQTKIPEMIRIVENKFD